MVDTTELPDAATFDAMSIPALLDYAVEHFGTDEAFVDGRGADALRYTFTQLAEEIDRTAAALIAAGISPGDRVSVWGPNSLRWLLAAMGVYRAGAILVPLNTRNKGPEAAYVLRTSGARLLFTVTDFLDTDYPSLLTGESAVDTLERIVVMSGAASAGTTAWEEFIADGGSVERAEVVARSAAVQPDDISDIMFTSGTTGKPKGAMIRHRASVKGFHAWASVVGLQHGDRYLIISPFFHTFGLKSGILACLIKGATILTEPVLDVPTVFARIDDEQVSMLPGAPSIHQTMLDHPRRSEFRLSSLRLAVTGAAPVSVELVRRMREELGYRTVVTGYGLTESTGIIAMCRHDDPDETIANTSGRAIPEVEMRVVDDDGNDVPAGQPGEVWARGYNVMAGYFNNDEATAETITPDGWLKTGDIAVMDERGYVDITDRKKDMFIMGGFNAYPAEIENVLSSHQGVSQVAVIGVPDQRMGEVGKAFIVARPGATIDPEEIIAWSRERMANYKVPRYVEVVESLPMNASGKVLKGDLRARS